MRVLLLGYGGALGREAQLLAGQGIDFYQRALQTPVSGQAWGPKSWGRLPGGFNSEPSFEREALWGAGSPRRAGTVLAQTCPSLVLTPSSSTFSVPGIREGTVHAYPHGPPPL